MKNKKVKIKNCPFCGKRPILYERKHGDFKHAIGCKNPECFLWIPESAELKRLHNYTTCYSNKKELLEAWNERAKR